MINFAEEPGVEQGLLDREDLRLRAYQVYQFHRNNEHQVMVFS